MNKILFGLILAAMVAVSESKSFYLKNPHIVTLKQKNFAEAVYASEYVWLVEFYKPNEKSSSKFRRTFEAVAKELHGYVPSGAVNCELHRELCDGFGITEYPKLLIFPADPIPLGENVIKVPIEYSKKMTKSAIIEEVKSHVPNYVSYIDDERFPKRLNTFLKETTPVTTTYEYVTHKLLMFPKNNEEPTEFIKATAINFHNLISFAAVKSATDETLERFGIDESELPVMILIPSKRFNNGDDTPVKYTGTTPDALFKFLSPYASTLKDGLNSLGRDEL